MNFHLPRPLHGWRAFGGEVGIIVIGVLIALAAEQVVSDRQWQDEVTTFRQAVDHELGRDLDVWDEMLKQRSCVSSRLDDLDRFLAASTAGRQLRLAAPIGRPISFSSYYSVWDDKGADVTSHLPLKVRLQYAELYDELHNQDVVRVSERDIWRSLARFDQPEPLDHQDRMLMRELLTRARQMDEAERSNSAYIRKLAAAIGISAVPDPNQPFLASASEFCRPLLARSATRA